MISEYVNQSVTLKAKSSTPNQYNEYTYTSSTIKGRFIYKRELFRLENGEEILSNAILYTMATVSEGDKITADSKDWVVRRVYPAVKLNGIEGFTKVML
jgi:hypothetical protein